MVVMEQPLCYTVERKREDAGIAAASGSYESGMTDPGIADPVMSNSDSGI